MDILCTYQGGKQRIAKDIVDVISSNDMIYGRKIYDLCCGSGALSMEFIRRGVAARDIVMLDKSNWGDVFRRIGRQEVKTDEMYLYYDRTIPKEKCEIKEYAKKVAYNEVNEATKEYDFLMLQACSFGGCAVWDEDGKWKKIGGWRDYWIPKEGMSRKSPCNPMMPMWETIVKRIEALQVEMSGVVGIREDINSIIDKIEEGSIVYIDPPYNDKQGYGYQIKNMEEVICKLRRKSVVYVSESCKISTANDTWNISKERTKGNINGKSVNRIEEWLNRFESI